MKEKICTFCGHRTIFDNTVREDINHTILDLIENHSVTKFYSGNMGSFDYICENELLNIKKIFSEVKLCWIAPYFTQEINKELNCDYDEIIVLDSSQTHYKRAIPERNRYMVRKSDFLLCYLRHDYGGAYDTMKYAEKLGVKIINI